MALLLRLSYTGRTSNLYAAIISTLALFCSCDGSLTVKPVNIEAVVGQRVQLNCSTSERYNVLWDHAPVRSTSRDYIFFSGVLVLPYSQRFQLDRDSATGVYNLVIPSVRKEDAGNYRCMDMVGHGEQAKAELIVLDSYPECETDAIKFCELTSQDFETTCAVGFSGNLVPEMECSSNGFMTSSWVVKEHRSDNVTYNLRLTAHWPLADDHPIVCRTSISHVSTFINSTVIYAFGSTQTLTMDHRKTVPVECKANSSEHCTYQWLHKDTRAVISSSQTLTAGEPGNYTCEATCMLRDKMCVVIPLMVNLATQEDWSDVSTVHSVTTTIILAAVVVSIGAGLGLIIAGVLVMVYYKKKGRRERSRDPKATNPCLGKTSTPNGTTSSPEISSDHEKLQKPLNGHSHIVYDVSSEDASKEKRTTDLHGYNTQRSRDHEATDPCLGKTSTPNGTTSSKETSSDHEKLQKPLNGNAPFVYDVV